MRHNLLPQEKKKELHTEYITRVLNVTLLLLTATTLLGATALIPAYVGVYTALNEITTLRDKEAQAQDMVEFKLAEAALAETAYTLRVIQKKVLDKPVTATISEVLSYRPIGVSMEEISFERDTGTVVIGGVAETRDALVSFKRTLEELDSIESVASPIENLAKNADLPFQLSFVIRSATST